MSFQASDNVAEPCSSNPALLIYGARKSLRKMGQTVRNPFANGNLPLRWARTNKGDGSMNSPQEMSHEDVLRVKLEVLRQKHRDLDEAIAALQAQGPTTALTVQRLKKEKLRLKDMIVRIEDELTPDIIA